LNNLKVTCPQETPDT